MSEDLPQETSGSGPDDDTSDEAVPREEEAQTEGTVTVSGGEATEETAEPRPEASPEELPAEAAEEKVEEPVEEEGEDGGEVKAEDGGEVKAEDSGEEKKDDKEGGMEKEDDKDEPAKKPAISEGLSGKLSALLNKLPGMGGKDKNKAEEKKEKPKF